MIEIKNLSLKRGKRQIISDLSFSVYPGEVTVLLGANGCGKTSLLECINQSLSYSGKILLGNSDLSKLSPKARGRQISLMPQLLKAPHITVRELVSLGRTPYIDLGKRAEPEDTAAISKAIEQAGILKIQQAFADGISGGELQKAYFAMLLAQNTDYLLLDEPTSHMDIAAGEEFLALVKSLVKKEHKGALLVMHDLTGALNIADRVALIREGCLEFEGSRASCLASGAIEKCFSVRRFEADGKVFFCV